MLCCAATAAAAAASMTFMKKSSELIYAVFGKKRNVENERRKTLKKDFFVFAVNQNLPVLQDAFHDSVSRL